MLLCGQQRNRVLRVGTQTFEGEEQEGPVLLDGEADGPPELLPAEGILDRLALCVERESAHPQPGLD